MNGYYIIARAWIGYSRSFPWFDDLNPLPDDQVAEQLNQRSRAWIRHNKDLARKRYREEHESLNALVKEARRRGRVGLPRGIPNMPMFDKMKIEGWLARLDRPALVEEASQYGIQLALTDQELRSAILAVRVKEHIQMEYQRRKWQEEDYAQRVKDQFDIKKRVRGDRQESTTEARIARVAGWTDINVRRFAAGGLWPTSRLMLHWFEAGIDEANSILHLANLRFVRPDWADFPVKFSIMSCSLLSPNELTMLEQQSQELLDPESKWTGTGLAQSIANDFKEIMRHRQLVIGREKSQRDQETRELPDTVADVVERERKEWFTVYELSKLSGLTEDQIEGRIRRWAAKEQLLEGTYRLQLPEANPGSARYIYRIHPIWPLLTRKAEISGKKSS